MTRSSRCSVSTLGYTQHPSLSVSTTLSLLPLCSPPNMTFTLWFSPLSRVFNIIIESVRAEAPAQSPPPPPLLHSLSSLYLCSLIGRIIPESPRLLFCPRSLLSSCCAVKTVMFFLHTGWRKKTTELTERWKLWSYCVTQVKIMVTFVLLFFLPNALASSSTK